ncbi:hypothetical protein bas03_0065 [Escherichia phage JulesPiccard]|uniref:Uncharacterized protein n=1 Tax=Escherichia phage JulesPiccard TaxID=2851956 RepID=A0AAE8B194_9CAUD|nr:hypothetical protein bas03_0065 [Escherichia phage JulesPiccard]
MGMFDFTEEKLTDEQIMQIAARDGLPPLRVAINANGYRQSQSFWCSVEELLCAKLDSKSGVVVLKIHDQSRNGKGVVGIRSTYEALRKVKPFAGLNGVMHDLKNNILPSLQDVGIICLIGDKIYVHPYIIGMHAIEVEEWCDPCPAVEQDTRLPYHLRYSEEEVEMAMDLYRRWNAVGK